jgi:hypothetical protein
MKRIPVALTVAYLSIYTTVLIQSLWWPVGDQTDVIRAGIAVFPIGLLLSFFYPEGLNDAFIAVSLAAVLNAAAIFYGSHLAIRRIFKATKEHSSKPF